MESPLIEGPAGRLEALLSLPPGGESSPRAAVVCHPHPLFAGTMHNKVVFHIARALAGLGWPVLRFNFRGVGASDGAFHAESDTAALVADASEDLDAAIAWLAARFPRAALCGSGFSFGSRTVLGVAARDGRIERVLAAGIPAGRPDFDVTALVAAVRQPKLFVQGADDEYGGEAVIRRVFAAATDPKRLLVIPGAGHFFEGKLDELRQAAAGISTL